MVLINFGNIILIILLVIALLLILVKINRNLVLRKIYNFRKELKKMRLDKKRNHGQAHVQDGTLIGHVGKRAVYIPDNAKHVFICGTTGSGKTVVISNFIYRIILKGYPSVILDGKGDIGEGSILDIVTKLNNQSENKRKIYVINLSDPSSSDKYNPFQGASPTVAKDMIINMTDWSEVHYKSNAERYIQRILQMLEKANVKLSFKKIIKCFPIENFNALSADLLKRELITKEQHVDNIQLGETSGKTAQNSMARFSTIAESEIGDIFTDDGIDISQALHENALIVFILNPLTYPELSPAFGRLVLIDAKKAIGNLFKSDIEKSFFLMDEINVYASPVLTDLVNKSRSAGVTCVLSTQSLSDLDYACGEAYKEQIIENCNNYIVMRQNSGVNAENWANILGTRATMDVTYQLQQKGLDTSETGFGSARRVREFLFHPDDIKTLQTGKGIFLSRDTNYHTRINVNKPF